MSFFYKVSVTFLILVCLVLFCQVSPNESVGDVSRKYHKSSLPGVLIIPGDGGNQLEAKLNKTSSNSYICLNHEDWFTIWLSLEELLPYVIGCWSDNILLEYDRETHTTSSPDGVEVRVSNFSDIANVEYLEYPALPYFAYVIAALEKVGYTRNVNLKGAPYDFRKAPNELAPYFANLTTLIEDLTASTHGPITLLVHSNGAPVLNYFLNTQTAEWRETHVGEVVALAGAWGGAVKALKVYAAGDNLNYRILNANYIRTVERSFPSLSFLLPDPLLWANHTMVRYGGENYTIAEVDQVFTLMGLPDAVAMHGDTRGLLDKYNTSPKVALHCLYGVNVPTVESLSYSSDAYFPDQPVVVTGDGDGTVNRRSAELCRRYSSLQSQPVNTIPVDKTDHSGILGSEFAIHYIVDMLTENAEIRTNKHSSSLLTYLFTVFEHKMEQVFTYVKSELNVSGIVKEIDQKAEKALKEKPIYQQVQTQIKLQERLNRWRDHAHKLDLKKKFQGYTRLEA